MLTSAPGLFVSTRISVLMTRPPPRVNDARLSLLRACKLLIIVEAVRPSSQLQILAQAFCPVLATQQDDRRGFDLADAVAREAELSTDLLESARSVVVEAETQLNHLGLSAIQSLPRESPGTHARERFTLRGA